MIGWSAHNTLRPRAWLSMCEPIYVVLAPLNPSLLSSSPVFSHQVQIQDAPDTVGHRVAPQPYNL